MSFTRISRDVDVHQNMPDYPSAEGYTAAQLKEAFDAPAEGLKTDVNGLMTELEDTSAAASLGAGEMFDGDSSDGTVQAKLEKLYEDLQGVALGDIPDGTITQAKMDSTYEGTLAKTDGTLQENLNAEMLNSKTEAQLKSSFLSTPNPTTVSYTGLSSEGTTTETKTVATNGGRYYFMLFNYNGAKIALYDAKTQKFVFGGYFGSSTSADSSQYGFNTTTLRLVRGYQAKATADLAVTYSSETLTLALTKKSDGNYSVPTGSITVFELGGIV